MEYSVLLAKIIGLYLFIVGLAIVARKHVVVDMIRDIVNTPSMLYLTSALTLVLGILLVITHSIWAWDWRLIITLIGWGLFIKAILRIFFPSVPRDMIKWGIGHVPTLMVTGFVFLILGIVLLYFGFVGGTGIAIS
ncbi:MAG: hypothetical protein HWD59_11580 [Coxiellaceae bacterium]|nr:MAG: hypothetical protein HWD59_11580 [Coxiellaceae bacterium]